MRNPLSQLPRYAFICFALLFCAIGCEKKNEGVLQIKLPADVISRSYDSEGSAQEVVAFLKNIGGSSIGIAEISTSCHCTSIGMLETTQLAPGQEAKLVLSATPPEFGTQHVTISVKYDATARRTAEAELVLTGRKLEVPFVQHVTPKSLHLRPQKIGEVANDHIEVTTNEYRNSEQWIVAMSCSEPSVQIESATKVTEEILDDSVVRRHYQFTVAGRLQSRKTVFTELEWQLHTSSQSPADRSSNPAPENTILPPARIRATVELAPAVTVVPTTLRCSTHELATEGKTIWLHSEDGIPFTVGESDPDSDFEIRNANVDGDREASTSVRVHIRLIHNEETAGNMPSPIEVAVRLSHPNCDHVIIEFEDSMQEAD